LKCAVLILRPEPGAAATARRALALGFKPIICPLFDVSPVTWDVPDPARFDAVMMTSAQAARLGGAQLAHYTSLPLYAVGAATADAARDAGFENVHAAEGDSAALLSLFARAGHQRILHLAGEHHRVPHTTLDITKRIVYAATAIAPPPALPDVKIILVHSPRAGARLAELITVPNRSSRTLIAISAATAQVGGVGWAAIHIAPSPNDDALLACAVQACKAVTK
jgi:uroporphyrinogen-III synthase